jgi:serine/threonine-protein kinase RsbW
MSTIEPPNEPPNVRLKLRNRPENVSLVRAVLVGVAEAIDLDDERLDDVRTAVTEACNNVVLHAYGGAEGPVEVDVRIAEALIAVVVRDAGIGISGREDASDGALDGGAPLNPLELDEESLKLGLPMIQALAATVEFHQRGGGGTEVRMEFATPGSRPFARSPGEQAVAPPIELLPLEGLREQRPELIAAATIAITPDRLARTVLPRLVSALAARANFSTDRLADAQLVADTIAAQAFGAIIGSHLDVGIAVEPRRVELLVGPLPAGREREAIAESVLGKLGHMMEKLIDDHSIAAVGSAAVLALQLIDRR